MRHCANLREVKKNARAYDSKAYEMKLGVTVRKDGKWYIAADPVTGVASQGKTCDEALRNFEEAFGLWFECAEEWER